MNTTRTITTSVVATVSDIITALKARHPNDINLRVLPSNGASVTVSQKGDGYITLTHVTKSVLKPMEEEGE